MRNYLKHLYILIIFPVVFTNAANVKNVNSSLKNVFQQDGSTEVGAVIEGSAVGVTFKTLPSLALTFPNGGEVWQPGEIRQIQWTASDLGGYVKLEYTTNVGQNWNVINSSIPLTQGQYDWLIPDIQSPDCKVRVTSTSNPQFTDESDSLFVIATQGINVYYPDGGEALKIGSIVQLSAWLSYGMGPLQVFFSSDNGQSWELIADSVSYPGNVRWVVPNIVSDSCRIKYISITNPLICDSSSGVFLLYDLSLVSPVGGEVWQPGESRLIQWSGTEIAGYLKIEYTSNNGESWNIITSSTPYSTGYYNWTIPEVQSPECKVRLSSLSYPQIQEISDSIFVIATQRINVHYPDGGEVLSVGSKIQLSAWLSYGMGLMEVLFSADDGRSWEVIADSVAYPGSIPWIVPDYLSDSCRIKYRSLSAPYVSDSSAGVFKIYKLNIVTPNDDEVWQPGQIRTIEWNADNLSGNSKIEYSSDNGVNWSIINNSVPITQGSYTWEVPVVQSESCLVRITSSNDSRIADQSDSMFVIATLGLRVDHPNGGEKLVAGSFFPLGSWVSYGISWMRIQYSTNSGRNWLQIADSVPYPGQYSWQVPDTPSDSCLVKYTSLHDTSVFDISNNVFKIVSDSNLVAHYPLDGNGNDLSGNGLHLNITGSPDPAANRFGSPGSALLFDGTSDILTRTNTPELLLNDYTLNAWIKTNYIPAGESIIISNYEHSVTGGYALLLGYGGFEHALASGQYILMPYPSNLVNRWIMLTAVKKSDSLYLYANGELLSATGGAPALLQYNNNTFRIGNGAPSGSLGYFKGHIDDTRVYKKALTPSEIQSLYHENGWPLPPVLTITGPSSGTAFAIGDSVEITWNSSVVQSIRLELVDQATGFRVPVADSIEASTGAYRFFIPNMVSVNARLVMSGVDAAISDSVTSLQITEGQSFWDNYSTPYGLNSIFFVNPAVGFAVGKMGKIYKTTDGGNLWIPKYNETQREMFSVSFLNPDTGFVGGSGILLFTSNGGDSWQVQRFDGSLYRKIQIFHKNLVWVLDWGGAVFKTTNLGANWINVGYTPYNSKDFQMLDSYTGWKAAQNAGGSNGVLLKTTDGAQNFNPVTVQNQLSSGDFFHSLYFNNSNLGWIAGRNIYKTTDAGVNWNRSKIYGRYQELNAIRFEDFKTGYAVGTKEGNILFSQSVYKTTDGGNNWFAIPLNGSTDPTATDIFVEKSTGAVFVVDEGGKIYRNAPSLTVTSPQSSDQWTLGTKKTVTWNSLGVRKVKIEYRTQWNRPYKVLWDSIDASLGTAEIFVPNPASESFIVRISSVDYPAVIALSDSIATVSPTSQWEQVLTVSGNEYINDIFLINASIGWVATTEVLKRTTTGGVTWQEISPGVQKPFHSLIFLNSDTGVVCASGYSTMFPYTTNGGISWTPVGIGYSEVYIKNFSSPGKSSQSIFGTTGNRIFRSFGFGQWQQLFDFGIYNTTGYLEFPSINKGFFVGGNPQQKGVIYTSTNEGITWSKIYETSASNSSFGTSSFLNPDTGVVAGENVIMRTTDAGGSWTMSKIWGTGNISSIKFISPAHLIGVGNNKIINGAIFESTDAGENWYCVYEDPYPGNSLDYFYKVSYSDSSNLWISTKRAVYKKKSLRGSISLLSPMGSETWPVGSSQNITWTSENVDSVKIELSTNNGSSWSLIADSLNSAQSTYPWTIPNLISDSCLIRIVDISASQIASVSDSVFRIVSPVPFTEVTAANLPGVSDGDIQWGDYDNDGDLDLLLTGPISGVGPASRIYRNDGNDTFTELTIASLIGVSESSVAWGDYDNDGDLDILLTGRLLGSSSTVSLIYKNNGNGTFSDQNNISLPGVADGSVAWGDYDNDGNLDFLLTGTEYNSGQIAKLYRNNGDGTFTSGISLTGVNYSSAAWGDYDNDGDLDILITGNNGSGGITKIYKNLGNGIFEDQSSVGILPVEGSSAAWGDYDNDGNLDILICGTSAGGRYTRIYRNVGDGTFTQAASLTGVSSGDAAWGDYDNDGDLDVILTGNTSTGEISRIYRNNGNGSFEYQSSIVLSGVSQSTVAFGDYDKDGDLDLILAGYAQGGSYVTKLYRNNAVTPNTLPVSPSNLQTSVQGDTVTFSWNKSTDNETPQDGLHYNLVVGTSPSLSDVVSPMSDTSTGFRRVVRLGNSQTNSWTLNNLPNGTYYWSVQAIDNGFAGSLFSDERSFQIASASIILLFPNGGEFIPSTSHQNIRWSSVNIDSVTIAYTTDNGSTWLPVIQSVPASSGSYLWPVPETHSRFCKVKITDASDTSVYDISDSVFEIHTYENLNIEFLGSYRTPGKVWNVKAAGGKAYLAESPNFSDAGLRILDVSNPQNITSLGFASTPTFNVLSLDLEGDYAYLANDHNGLTAVNVSNPASPQISGNINTPGSAYDVDVSGTYAYIADDAAGGLRIINISNPASPSEVGIYNTPGTARGVKVVGNYAYIADYEAGLRIVNVSNPANPVEVGSYPTGDKTVGVDVVGNTAYLADGQNGLVVLNVTNPVTPQLLDHYDFAGGNMVRVKVVDSIAFVAAEVYGVRMIDVSNPLDISAVGYYLTPGRCYGVDVVGSLVYAAIYDSGMYVLKNTLLLPSIAVTFPQGGEIWQVGSAKNITWTSQNIDSVKISYSTDNGATWTAIVSSHPASPGVYYWLVPNTPSVNCLVKIVSLNDTSVSDVSDSSFSIVSVPAINITGLTGNNNWVGGSIQQISWISSLVDSVKIQYAFPSGTTWFDIISSLPGSALSHKFVVQNDWYASVRLRVIDISNAAVGDTSEGAISIQQSFTQMQNTVVPVRSGKQAWGDIDNDGDHDLIISGYNFSAGGSVTKVYRNDNGTLAEISTNLFGLNSSDISLGDYNFDGTLDLIISGYNESNAFTQLYSNQAGVFTLDTNTFIGVADGSSEFVDFDQDGDLDIFIMGSIPGAGTNYISRIYLNDGGDYVMTDPDIPGYANKESEWDDLDNDGDLDLVIGAQYFTNEDSALVSHLLGIPILPNASVSIGDYNSDGFKDLAVAGGSSGTVGEYQTHIFSNTGSGFVRNEQTFLGLTSGSIKWFDYNNDGDLDFIVSGYGETGNVIVKMYINMDTIFIPLVYEFPVHNPIYEARVEIVDLDNDADLDVCLVVGHGLGNSVYLLRNNFTIPNTAPSVPANLSSTVNGNKVKLQWNRSTDNETDQAAITYNLRVGTTPGGNEIISPMSDLSTGKRKINAWGRTGSNNWYDLKNLPNGTYYWSVQAIDNGFAGSAFSTEGSFTIGAAQPSLTLTAPNGGESWKAGSVKSIRWTSSNVDTIAITYSTNNGSSWITLAARYPAATDSFSWTIPNTPSQLCRVRLRDIRNNGAGDTSAAPFTITAPSSVTLLTPNGGESLEAGALYQITWNYQLLTEGKSLRAPEVENLSAEKTSSGKVSADHPASVSLKIAYSTNNGTTWLTVTDTVTASSGVYTWLVPQTPSDRCLVRISDPSDTSLSDQSDALFTIYPAPVLALLSPDGGEVWRAGSHQAIHWSSSGVDTIAITYSTNNGSSWITLAARYLAAVDSFSWTIPNTPSQLCRVRIRDIRNNGVGDTSAAPFTITALPSLTLLTPNGGDSLEVGSLYQITWKYQLLTEGKSLRAPKGENLSDDKTFGGKSSPDHPAAVLLKIAYSTNNGTTWLPVADTVTASLGVYTWLVPQTPSDRCLVRISDPSDTSLSDLSDAPFTIYNAPVLALLSPVGGELWSTGSVESVRWTSSNVDTIAITYSTNNGSSWITLAARYPAAADSFSWTIPNTPSQLCRVRIRDIRNNGVGDTSAAPFTIEAPSSMTTNLSHLSFGRVYVGSDSLLRITIGNNGYSPLVIDSVRLVSGLFLLSIVPGTIVPDSAAELVVRFAPAMQQMYTDTLLIYNNSRQRLLRIPVSGEGYFRPSITLTSPAPSDNWKVGAVRSVTWDMVNVSQVSLWLSTDDGANWIEMESSWPAASNVYLVAVPLFPTTTARVKVVSLEDPSLIALSSPFTIFTYPAAIDISVNISAAPANSVSGYRMFSLPGNNNLHASQVFSGEPKFDWMMEWDNGAAENYMVRYDGSENFRFSPGKAFWLLTMKPVSVSASANNVAIDSTNIFRLPLHNGWNQIANPFRYQVSWNEVRALNNLSANHVLHFWQGNWSQETMMMPYAGYYYNNVLNFPHLQIPYNPDSTLTLPKQKFGKTGSGTELPGLRLMSKDGQQAAVSFAFNKISVLGYDEYDYFAPPDDFSLVSLMIRNDSLHTNYRYLQSDSRNSSEEDQEYLIRIRNRSETDALLLAEGSEQLGEKAIMLVDTRYGRFFDLQKVTQGVTIDAGSDLLWKVYIGSAAYIESKKGEYAVTEFRLYGSYPNPFNSMTSVSFALPAAGRVSMIVYDILGRQVRNLTRVYPEAGYQEIGIDAAGLASGVYIYTLRFGETSLSGKIILNK